MSSPLVVMPMAVPKSLFWYHVGCQYAGSAVRNAQ